jgi:F0F1-type ATP synthase assembly protein I
MKQYTILFVVFCSFILGFFVSALFWIVSVIGGGLSVWTYITFAQEGRGRTKQ